MTVRWESREEEDAFDSRLRDRRERVSRALDEWRDACEEYCRASTTHPTEDHVTLLFRMYDTYFRWQRIKNDHTPHRP